MSLWYNFKKKPFHANFLSLFQHNSGLKGLSNILNVPNVKTEIKMNASNSRGNN